MALALTDRLNSELVSFLLLALNHSQQTGQSVAASGIIHHCAMSCLVGSVSDISPSVTQILFDEQYLGSMRVTNKETPDVNETISRRELQSKLRLGNELQSKFCLRKEIILS